MEITENTICKFYSIRPRQRKRRKEAQKTIIDIGLTQREIDSEMITEKLGADYYSKIDGKNHRQFFPMPLHLLIQSFDLDKELSQIISELNDREVTLSEAIIKIEENIKFLINSAPIKVRAIPDYKNKIIWLVVGDGSIVYKILYFEPVE